MITKAKRLSIIFAGIVLGIVIAELMVRAWLPQNLSGSWRVQGTNGLWLNKDSGVARHQFKNRVVYYNFSEWGARGYGENSNPDIENMDANSRVLVLGDSFTFGWLLKQSDTFISKLSEELVEYEFINVAAGGWGLSDYLAYTETYCSSIAPEFVFVVFTGTEFSRALESPLYQVNNEGVLVKGTISVNLLKRLVNSVPGYNWLIEHSHVVTLLRLYFSGNLVEAASVSEFAVHKENVNTDYSANVRFFERIVSRLVRQIDACGAQPIFVYLGWNPPKNLSLEVLLYIEAVRESLLSDGSVLHSLESTNALKKVHENPTKFVIPDEGHPNEDGADVIYHGFLEGGVRAWFKN